jgi:hypothetical protein
LTEAQGGIAGGTLADACEDKERRSWCLGYIQAIKDFTYVNEKLLCATPGSSAFAPEHLRVLVLAYFYAHPQVLGKYAGISVRAALNEAFPCK